MTKQLTLAAALVIVALAGCSNSADDAAPVNTQESTAVALPEEPAPAPTTEPTAPIETVPATLNATAELPPEEAPAPDEQMMDDAAATGMTARSTRGEPAAEDTAPAEAAERE